MIKTGNNIRYAKVRKFAYGTDQPNADTGQMINSTADSIGAATPWYAYANQAQTGVRQNLSKKKVTNPETGEVYEYETTDEGQIMNEIAQPMHEKYAQELSKDNPDYLKMAMDSNIVTQVGYNALYGKKQQDKENRGKEEEAKAAQSRIDAKNAKLKQDFEDKQRDAYSRSYLTHNPASGQTGATLYAYGTEYKGMAIPKRGMGGELNPLASDVTQAEGQTHEEGGITLTDNSGTPTAEVEDKEVVVADKQVLSDRIPFNKDLSFAQKGEELGKEKGKNEEKLKNANFFEKNTATRNIEKIDKKMDMLLKLQDITRQNLGLDVDSPVNNAKYGGNIPKYWKGTREDEDSAISTDENGNQFINKYKTDVEPSYKFNPNRDIYANPDEEVTVPGVNKTDVNFSNVIQGYKGETDMNGYKYDSNSDTFIKTNSKKGGKFNTKGLGEGLQNAAPYLDNIINAGLIKQTPQIPKPVMREAIDEMAMPLNTTYNINPALIASNRDTKEYNKTILENTASSNDARGLVASGLAKKLRNNNDIYAQKENIENQLKNQNALNIQSVNSRNVGNRQDISNFNKGRDDKYNWDNMLRDSDIQDRISKLGAETTNDITTGMQDKRMAELDNKKIFYDSLKYDDASGFETLLGTDEMKNLMKDPKTKKAVYDSLKRGGQEKTYKKAKELYGE